jgi:hypothetical protein
MRWVAGWLLVVAAALKAAKLIAEPGVVFTQPLGRYFLPTQCGVELAIGLLLLFGINWRILRWLAIILFTGFAAYSLYLAISGRTSCGCFGPIYVNPWWTFGLDVAVTLGLLSSVLTESQVINQADVNLARPTTFAPSLRIAIALISGFAVVSMAIVVRYTDQQTVFAHGHPTSANGAVVLSPEQWIGAELPIADLIDVDLSRGEWVVLLHRHDCPACQEKVPKYEQRATAGERVALIEVPPYGDVSRQIKACHYGRLRADHNWFVETPIEIRLRDGIVTTVKKNDD